MGELSNLTFLFQMILLLCLAILVPPARLESDRSYLQNNDNTTWPDLRAHHRIQDSYLLDRYRMGELPNDYSHCKRPAKCIYVRGNTCMGRKLPYDYTTMDHIPEDTTQAMIEVSFCLSIM